MRKAAFYTFSKTPGDQQMIRWDSRNRRIIEAHCLFNNDSSSRHEQHSVSIIWEWLLQKQGNNNDYDVHYFLQEPISIKYQSTGKKTGINLSHPSFGKVLQVLLCERLHIRLWTWMMFLQLGQECSMSLQELAQKGIKQNGHMLQRDDRGSVKGCVLALALAVCERVWEGHCKISYQKTRSVANTIQVRSPLTGRVKVVTLCWQWLHFVVPG